MGHFYLQIYITVTGTWFTIIYIYDSFPVLIHSGVLPPPLPVTFSPRPTTFVFYRYSCRCTYHTCAMFCYHLTGWCPRQTSRFVGNSTRHAVTITVTLIPHLPISTFASFVSVVRWRCTTVPFGTTFTVSAFYGWPLFCRFTFLLPVDGRFPFTAPTTILPAGHDYGTTRFTFYRYPATRFVTALSLQATVLPLHYVRCLPAILRFRSGYCVCIFVAFWFPHSVLPHRCHTTFRYSHRSRFLPLPRCFHYCTFYDTILRYWHGDYTIRWSCPTIRYDYHVPVGTRYTGAGPAILHCYRSVGTCNSALHHLHGTYHCTLMIRLPTLNFVTPFWVMRLRCYRAILQLPVLFGIPFYHWLPPDFCTPVLLYSPAPTVVLADSSTVAALPPRYVLHLPAFYLRSYYLLTTTVDGWCDGCSPVPTFTAVGYLSHTTTLTTNSPILSTLILCSHRFVSTLPRCSSADIRWRVRSFVPIFYLWFHVSHSPGFCVTTGLDPTVVHFYDFSFGLRYRSTSFR